MKGKNILGGLVHCFASAQGSLEGAYDAARRRGLLDIRAAAVAGTSAVDVGGIGRAIESAFFASLDRGPGIFDAIAARSRRAAFNCRTFIPTAPAVAEITAEGTAVRLSRFSLTPATLTPTKAVGLIVATEESLATPEGSAAAAEELRQAVTLATDIGFLDALTPGFSDSLTSDTLADIRTLCDAVSLTGLADLVMVASPEIANAMATNPVDFPDMRPTGGTAAGIDVLVSSACPGLMLIDCGAILTGSQGFELRYSTSASIEMDDSPAMDGTPTGPSGAMVSCFQADAAAIIGHRTFAALTARASGVAVLAGSSS
ncbi:MAG: hypothetical protein RBU21_10230 [FCB group bacterium]|jgi:hypothetical protein|nr:hypothetical protein [FCB group bacterium]